MTYKIIYTETLFHEFYIDSDREMTSEEVIEEFVRMASNSELDFSYGELIDSDVAVEEVPCTAK